MDTAKVQRTVVYTIKAGLHCQPINKSIEKDVSVVISVKGRNRDV